MDVSPELAEQAATWLIAGVVLEGERSGKPLSSTDRDRLASSVLSLADFDRLEMIALNNKVVDLARSAMELAKANGEPTVKPRRGLRLPADWVGAYQVTFAANNEWLISSIMQNAILQNPLAGERRNWKSR